ncbi:hypothetical protein L596_028923 [Steinernema carpocapsae]|uniref:Uncharacterized protein n=1 Tax=Steinernema carpocapsae TaxID=34508 RepID=A0A4U5LZT6_STECR|nr:hypothetical protein L596_028923 [Steinernema carpocapsae]
MGRENSITEKSTRRFHELNGEFESVKSKIEADGLRLRRALKMENYLRNELQEEIKYSQALQQGDRELYGTGQLYAHFEDVLESAELLCASGGRIPGISDVRTLARKVALRLIKEFTEFRFANPIPENLKQKVAALLGNVKVKDD